MIDFTPDGIGIPISIPSEHGQLYGELAVLPDSPGIIVLLHASMALDEKDLLLARQFRNAGFSTLSANLLAHQEEHYPDIHNNVPLLARRLVDFLGLIKNRMSMGEMREQAVGLFASNATTPAAIRVAALRDHDIAAIVCRGGLIDLAGALYLHSLSSPLLILAEEEDLLHTASNRRALKEISCPKELRIIPETGPDYAVSPGFAISIRESMQWFAEHFGGRELLR